MFQICIYFVLLIVILQSETARLTKRQTALLTQALSTCESGKYYTNPYNCSKFFMCSNGQKISFSCAPPLFWDNNITACVRSSNSCQVALSQNASSPLVVSASDTTFLQTLLNPFTSTTNLFSNTTDSLKAINQLVNEITPLSTADLLIVSSAVINKTYSLQATPQLVTKNSSNSTNNLATISNVENKTEQQLLAIKSLQATNISNKINSSTVVSLFTLTSAVINKNKLFSTPTDSIQATAQLVNVVNSTFIIPVSTVTTEGVIKTDPLSIKTPNATTQIVNKISALSAVDFLIVGTVVNKTALLSFATDSSQTKTQLVNGNISNSAINLVTITNEVFIFCIFTSLLIEKFVIYYF